MKTWNFFQVPSSTFDAKMYPYSVLAVEKHHLESYLKFNKNTKKRQLGKKGSYNFADDQNKNSNCELKCESENLKQKHITKKIVFGMITTILHENDTKEMMI